MENTEWPEFFPVDDNDMMCCSAYTEGPDGQTMCEALAPFEIVRIDGDTNLYSCPEHLGPLLAHADNVPWPPMINWEGPGDRPPNALSQEETEARNELFAREIFGELYPDSR